MTIIEQMKEYQTRRAMGFPNLQYTTMENGVRVTVDQCQETVRYDNGTVERKTVINQVKAVA